MRCLSAVCCAVVLIGLSLPAVADESKEGKAETVSVFGDEMTVPVGFKRVKPKSGLLEHEFEVSAGEGDDAATARLTMMPAGGGVEANIVRWKGQFTGGDPEKQTSKEIKVGDWAVHLVDVSGSFSERVGGGPFAGGRVVVREDYAMAGAILAHPTGRLYFLKMIGPSKVIKENREEFVKMVKSLDQ